MIVENPQKTIQQANEISSELLRIISNKMLELRVDEDPAEQIYLVLHTIALLSFKSIASLEGYCKIYNIEKLNKSELKKWLKMIIDEYVTYGVIKDGTK